MIKCNKKYEGEEEKLLKASQRVASALTNPADSSKDLWSKLCPK